MNETTTLTCKFIDSQDQLRSVNIRSLVDNLSSEKITSFMPYVISSKVLIINDTQPNLKFISIIGTSVTRTSVENTRLDWQVKASILLMKIFQSI